MSTKLIDILYSLDVSVEEDYTSEVSRWFMDNLYNEKGFWKWPDLYFISQEPQMKWWKDTVDMLINDNYRVISYNSRKYLYRDLKKWLITAAKMNFHEW